MRTRPTRYLLGILALLVVAVAWTGNQVATPLRYQVVQPNAGMVFDTWTRQPCTVQQCVSLPDKAEPLSYAELAEYRSLGLALRSDSMRRPASGLPAIAAPAGITDSVTDGPPLHR